MSHGAISHRAGRITHGGGLGIDIGVTLEENLHRGTHALGEKILLVLGMALLGCDGATETGTPTPDLPTDTAETDVPWVDTGVFRPDNTGTVALGNDVPANTVILEQSGVWMLSGNPYDALIGSFQARELINGNDPGTGDTAQQLDCNVSYSLQGTPAPPPTGCPSCGHVWDIQFTVDADSITDTSLCNDPDLPQDGDTWRMGYAGAAGTIHFNFYGSGVWVPWWGAAQSGDTVIFEWTRELAIDIPAPEEDQ